MAASTQTELEAYAFRQLVAHLRDRPEVQNIDQMNLAGFCRNCLSKWYLRGARERGVAMTYDEALERVYGEPYAEWKKKHQKKATPEQMALFESGAHLHAKHPKMDDDQAPAGRSDPPTPTPTPDPAPVSSETPSKKVPYHPSRNAPPARPSDVCCQDEEEIIIGPPPPGAPEPAATEKYAPPPPFAKTYPFGRAPPDEGPLAIRLGVLTVSDRAHLGVYEDASGPAVGQAVERFAERSNGAAALFSTLSYVVPDDPAMVASRIEELCNAGCNLVLTTGGTGLSPRDQTPEATMAVLDKLAPGISQAIVLASLAREPHAMLSRGVAGVRDRSLIVNLPGRPRAAEECFEVVAPVLVHALRQVAREDDWGDVIEQMHGNAWS